MRRTVIAIALTLSPLYLAACGGGSDTSASAAGRASGAGCTPVVEGVKTANQGKLTMAVAEYPPYVSLKGGKLSGVDGAVLARVAEKLCLTPDAKTSSFTAIVESVKNGQSDLSAGNWYINAERGAQFELSKPVYLDKMALLTKGGATTLDAISGGTVGTPQGYLWVEDLQKALGASKVKLYATEDAVFQDVRAGRINAGVMTFGGANQLAKANGNSGLQVKEMEPDDRVQASVGAAQTAVLIHKGNTALQEAVNTVVQQMRNDGSLAKALEDNGLPASAADVPAAGATS